MTSITTGIKTIMHSASYISGVSTFVARRRPWMRILMYHGIGFGQADRFAKQLVYLTKRFPIVPLGLIIKKLSNPSSRPSGEIALTFDDGLRNHYRIVYPILKRMNLPATFFVCPGLLGTDQWLWNHEARARLRGMRSAQHLHLHRVLQAPASEAEGIVEWMKTLSLEKRREVENTIRAATPEFKPEQPDKENFDIMSWEELSSLDPHLIMIGSHTVNHPVLTRLSKREIEFELRDSRAQLEKRLGRPIEYFCYPNGACDDRVLEYVRENYRSAVTTKAGAVVVGDNLYTLSRIPSAIDLPLLVWRMHRPEA